MTSPKSNGSPVSADHTPSRPSCEGATGDSGSPSNLIGEVIADRYRVEELIGQGGMGAVYRAEHVHIKRTFALKVLHPELTHHAEAVRRFEREAIAAARISHPNVAGAVDFGRLSTGEFYLVLDYVRGKSLRSLIASSAPFSETRTIAILRQVALALSAAHAAGIVHRDLKPDNVMLVDDSRSEDPIKVLDFGIAKLRTEDVADEPAITRFGTVFGTPEYMSPEQALGQSVDFRSDLYSLGIMAYEMLTGQTPFADEQLVTVLSRQMTELPKPIETVSRPLGALVLKLLEKDPARRPESADILVELLDGLPTAPSQIADAARNDKASAASRLQSADTLLAEMTARHAPGGTSPHPGEPARPLYSMPVWAKRQITIAGRRVPWVLIALTVGLVAITVALTATLSSMLRPSEASPTTADPASSSPDSPGEPPISPVVAEQLLRATEGDAAALAALEARPEAERSASIQLALGAGHAKTKSYGRAVEAIRRAFSLNPKLEPAAPTVSALYQAALFTETSSAAIDVAVSMLGARGPDLLYAVYEAAGANPSLKLDRKKLRQLLDSTQARQSASSALRVALELESAKSCPAYKSLLPAAAADGDARSLKTLRRLSYDRGCGLLKLADCYACLRGGRALRDALESAKNRPAPTF